MEEKYNKEVLDGLDDLKKLLESEEDGYNSYNEIMKLLGLDLKDLENQMSDNTKIVLEYTSDNQIELKYNYLSDSGFDLFSNEDIIVPPFGRTLVPTGIRVSIPENYEIQIRSKSGLAINQGLMVLNSPGTIDEGYTGEIKVIIFNTNNHEVKINKGMKIAQGVLSSCIGGRWVKFEKVESINDKERGGNGFGSTGI